jgi:hypothetical protein
MTSLLDWEWVLADCVEAKPEFRILKNSGGVQRGGRQPSGGEVLNGCTSGRTGMPG